MKLPKLALAVCMVLWGAVMAGRSSGQTVSVRSVGATASSWFLESAWSQGIPQNAGDVADVRLTHGGASFLSMESPVTLGQLLVSSSAATGVFNLSGVGPLSFESAGSPLVMRLTPHQATGSVLTANVIPSVRWNSGETLYVEASPATTWSFASPFGAGSGDLVQQGGGRLNLSAANAAWNGRLTVDGGTVSAVTATSLGTAVGDTTIKNGGRLILNGSTGESFVFDGGTIQAANYTLAGPMRLDGAATLVRPKNPPLNNIPSFPESSIGNTVVSGAISGAGSLTIDNQSRDQVQITGVNAYSGETYVLAGMVFAMNSSSLGSTAGGTTVRGGMLSIRADMDESFRVEGGELRIDSTSYDSTQAITVAGGSVYLANRDSSATPIVMAGNGAVFARSGIWTGGSTGLGNLTIGGSVDGALAHQGDLTLASAKLNVANAYAGATRSTGESEVNHAQAFGQSQQITVGGGTLRLNVLPAGTPEYFVRGGDLSATSSIGTIASDITLGGGTLDAGIRGSGIYSGDITLESSGIRKLTIGGGTFNGRIAGDASVAMWGGVYLNAANDISGGVDVQGEVYLNHAEALRLRQTNVSLGTLHVNVPTTAPVIANGGAVKYNVAQDFAGTTVLHHGTLDAAAEVGVDRLLALSTVSDYSKIASSGGAVRIDDELINFHSSQISAKLTGTGTIRHLGWEMRLNGDLSDFAGEVSVERGSLLLAAGANTGTAPIFVRGEGQLDLSGDYQIDGDVFLQNGAGRPGGRHASLTHTYNGSEAAFRGRLDVGDGAAIQSGSGGRLVLEGRLTGRNLDVLGGGVEVKTMQSQLGGTLRVTNDAGLNIGASGGFQGLDEIRLENDGVLYLYPSAHTDRIGDSTVVASRGGFLSIVSERQTPVHETIGKLRIEPGITRIAVSSDHGSLQAGLDIEALERERGGVMEFIQSGRVSDTRIENFATLANGMIGPWAFTEWGFAVLDGNQEVQTLAANRSTLAGAQAADDVRLAAAETLSGDLTIHTLDSSSTNNSIDLGGAQLAIGSGGVRQVGNISNGRLTAGNGDDAELLIHRSGGRISADIVDNGDGAVGLVASDSRVTLSGDNSYTGGTWVVGRGDITSSFSSGQLSIENLSAIPENDRVFVDHGIYNVDAIIEGTIRLAELHIRNGGRVNGNNSAPIEAGLLEFEEGTLVASLTGSGAVRKTTDGFASFVSAVSPNYTGVVTVEDGTLLVQTTSAPQAKFLLQGGLLEFSGEGGVFNDVTLDGGALGGGNYHGLVNVTSDSTIYYDGPYVHLRGKLVGEGDLTVRGNYFSPFARYVGLFGDASEYQGDFHVASGVLQVATDTVSAGGGDFIVEQAGRLHVGQWNSTAPPLNITNDVHLHGGALYSMPAYDSFYSTAPHNIITGRVVVHDEAFIGATRTGLKSGVVSPGLIMAGQVELTDGAQVHGLSGTNHAMAAGDVALVDVAGELLVGADVTWNLLTSSLSISGAIRANAAAASINFVGRSDLLRLEQADIKVGPGQSLAILRNGEAAPLTLAGPEAELGGSGTIIGDVSVTDGATISPGDSPGWLTVDGDVSLGAGGSLSVELAGTRPGADYDVLQATGEIDLSGGLLDLSLLDGFRPTASDGFAILRAPSITGKFANAGNSITVGEVTLPVTYFKQMVVLGNVAAVPEPAGTALCVAAALGGFVARRRRLLRRRAA